MLSKEAFVEAINYLKKEDEFYSKQYRLYDDYRDVIGDSLPVMYTGAAEIILKLLEESFALDVDNHYGSTLSWWIYEINFGEDFKLGDIETLDLPEGHEFRTPDLSDVDKLYDYLAWCYEDKRLKELICEIENN